MKRNCFWLLLLVIPLVLQGQEYKTNELELTARIWSQCYLFHPSVIRADRRVNWEEELLDFLPELKKQHSPETLAAILNRKLLASLEDEYTMIQLPGVQKSMAENLESTDDSWEYIRLTAELLSDMHSLGWLDSLLRQADKDKPLVVDCRIAGEVLADKHTYTPFHYFASMFLTETVPLSQLVAREHFGWDEYNDWWFYEQRWKLRQADRQQRENGQLLPFAQYQQEVHRQLADFDFEHFHPRANPVYFIANRTFLSCYQSLLQSVQIHREQMALIIEDSGEVIAGSEGIREYQFGDFPFLLNTTFSLNQGSSGPVPLLSKPHITRADLEEVIRAHNVAEVKKANTSMSVAARKYLSSGESLTVEERILGMVKLWTVVKYFYPYLDQRRADWDTCLAEYLEMAQACEGDKEYYRLIQGIMATLDDSHVSTYHPSILDFSEIFIAPVSFEWIEGRVLVTQSDSLEASGLSVGDEIVAIDGRTIADLLKQESAFISSSNRQGLLTTVINPGFFTGPEGSQITFRVKKGKEILEVTVPRSVYVFQYLGQDDHRPESKVYDKSIGYLNLSALTEPLRLEEEMYRMQNTEGLILDLRNSYPTIDYQRLLEMLCSDEVVYRRSRVPIVSAEAGKIWQSGESRLIPDPDFSYSKPIAVLIDKSMISRPEDVALALRSLPNVHFFGEQTQGTNGEMTKIHLPGGGETSFTGQMIFYPDGSTFQTKGILPDTEVHKTREGLLAGKDEILEKALEWLRQ